MDPLTLLGLAAGSLTTVSFLPQVIKTWKSRSAKDISLGMFLLFSLGIILWIVYGFRTGSWPIIAANAATLVLAGIIIVMKLSFKE